MYDNIQIAMKRIIFISCAAMAMLAVSCTKTIDKEVPSNEVSLLELKLEGQMGTAVIERDGQDASATIYIMQRDDYPYSAVTVEGIVVSRFATASVSAGETLDFSNPERKARITVTSESGKSLDWWIYIEPYDAFYVGTWKIDGIFLHCNQKISSSGDGEWDTAISGSEFGDNGVAEYDNIITVTLDEEMSGNALTGTITNEAGPDGEYANFWGVMAPYSEEAPLDMNPRLRHLLPAGTADWELDLTTNQMRISKDNVTSTMTFENVSGSRCHFCFNLPSAAGEPAGDNFYNNMWRSSTQLRYEVTRID